MRIGCAVSVKIFGSIWESSESMSCHIAFGLDEFRDDWAIHGEVAIELAETSSKSGQGLEFFVCNSGFGWYRTGTILGMACVQFGISERGLADPHIRKHRLDANSHQHSN